MTFRAQDSGDAAYLGALQRHCPARTLLTLKPGAQVILVKTLSADAGLVNGLRGVVLHFDA